MGVALLSTLLSFGLLLLILSLFTLLFVNADSPSFVPAILALAANLITVTGAWLILRKLSAHEREGK